MKGLLRAPHDEEESSYPDDASCVICDRAWTDPARVFRLDCGHVVHRKCWRGAAADDGCPECAETDSQFEARMASWENLVVLAKAYQARQREEHAEPAAPPPAAAAAAGSHRAPPSAEAPGRRPAAAAAAQTGSRRAPADAGSPPRRRPPSQPQQPQPTAPLMPRPQQREQFTDASSASQSLASFSSGNRSHATTTRPAFDAVLATPRPTTLPMPQQQPQQQAPPTRRPAAYDPSFDYDLMPHAGVAPSRTHDSGSGSVSRRPASFVVSPNASFSSSGVAERVTAAAAAWGGDGQAASSSGRRGSQASVSSRDVLESSFDNFAADDRSVVRRRIAGVPLSAFDAPSPSRAALAEQVKAKPRPRAHSRAFI